MISGALMGFVSGVAFGLARANSWPLIVGRASVVSFCSGLLMRWWGRVWLKNLRASQAQRLAAETVKSPSSPVKP
jgi:hypothetical protein